MSDEPFILSIKARVGAILGWEPESWREIRGGYTPAARYVVARGGRSAFVKAGTTALTARLLNREINAYQQISAPFMPGFVGCDTDDERPLLVTEDLSGATWPPPWTRRTIDIALDTIASMHQTPADLPAGGLLTGREAGWPTVAADPAPFLALGLVSADWLEAALPTLMAAEASCELAGSALTHLDLRSDNMCFVGGRAKLVDWAEACLSNRQVDLGFWLPSLAYEGGPAPEEILPDAPAIAATVAGFFAARAGLPIIPDAPNVRRVQREQLSTALPWAQRALGLPSLDEGNMRR
ncbi:phosphotransferase [Devosia nitrariae]|uniref:Aminoglycoside phosphotransferase domain-containing protein n=1 Tax=Devosia nitrariae TaxID=2071872 RepID=A0ABQ5W390_9HYPH|nr:phosphotransferase [Devosia nitrariae]GLQ54130.1 hypothetical protein GCM10010862_13890 [Devosia nitrariae]